MSDPLRERLAALGATWQQPVDASAFGTEVGYEVYNEARKDCAAELTALLHEPPEGAPVPLSANPLTHELLDLIRLMPDHQVDEILEFIRVLREARRLTGRTAAPEPPR